MTRGAEPVAALRGEPVRGQPLLDQRGQHVLLGERLGADHVAALRATNTWQQRGQQDEHETGAAQRDAQTAVLGNAAFHQRQQLIDHQRQRGGGDAAEQHEHPVLRLQTGEDVIAQAGLAYWCRQRCRADHPDRRGADAGHDHRHRQRQFDVAQHLAGLGTDHASGFEQRAVDAVEPDHGVAQHRQHRIKRQRQHRGQETERRKALAEQPLGQAGERQQHRIKQRQQRKARNGLHHTGNRQQDTAQQRPLP